MEAVVGLTVPAHNQQMGDGGLIAQITDDATREIVAVTDASWSALAEQRAPLNTECERDADPEATCEFEQIATPKDGYNEISWDPSTKLIWGSDLEIDNIIL